MTSSQLSMWVTPAGNIVRQTDQGVVQGGFFIQQPPSAYGSPARLSHCVFMGPKRLLPANPDAAFLQPSGPFGGLSPTGMTAIEVLGHEYGHHWLAGMTYDLGDGARPQTLLRGDTRDGTTTASEWPLRERDAAAARAWRGWPCP